MMDPKVAGYAKHKFQEIQKAYSDILVKEQGKECFMIVISGRLLKNFINSQFYQIREKNPYMMLDYLTFWEMMMMKSVSSSSS